MERREHIRGRSAEFHGRSSHERYQVWFAALKAKTPKNAALAIALKKLYVLYFNL
jgi:uncharacterized membrane protein YkvA (DUF1232 family)